MPTYAPIPQFADRRPAPKALTIIVAAHAAAIAAVMTAKMEIIAQAEPPTVVRSYPVPKPPPPEPRADPKPQRPTSDPVIDRTPTVVPVPPIERPIIATDPILQPPFPLDPVGPSVDPQPVDTIPKIARTGPRFATPDWALKPPYPEEKRRTEEEAVLKLKLTIDARGRVVAVEPLGRADPVFLAAARKHLLTHWRYRPATEDGRAMASATVIALRFELED